MLRKRAGAEKKSQESKILEALKDDYKEKQVHLLQDLLAKCRLLKKQLHEESKVLFLKTQSELADENKRCMHKRKMLESQGSILDFQIKDLNARIDKEDTSDLRIKKMVESRYKDFFDISKKQLGQLKDRFLEISQENSQVLKEITHFENLITKVVSAKESTDDKLLSAVMREANSILNKHSTDDYNELNLLTVRLEKLNGALGGYKADEEDLLGELEIAQANYAAVANELACYDSVFKTQSIEFKHLHRTLPEKITGLQNKYFQLEQTLAEKNRMISTMKNKMTYNLGDGNMDSDKGRAFLHKARKEKVKQDRLKSMPTIDKDQLLKLIADAENIASEMSQKMSESIISVDNAGDGDLFPDETKVEQKSPVKEISGVEENTPFVGKISGRKITEYPQYMKPGTWSKLNATDLVPINSANTLKDNLEIRHVEDEIHSAICVACYSIFAYEVKQLAYKIERKKERLAKKLKKKKKKARKQPVRKPSIMMNRRPSRKFSLKPTTPTAKKKPKKAKKEKNNDDGDDDESSSSSESSTSSSSESDSSSDGSIAEEGSQEEEEERYELAGKLFIDEGFCVLRAVLDGLKTIGFISEYLLTDIISEMDAFEKEGIMKSERDAENSTRNWIFKLFSKLFTLPIEPSVVLAKYQTSLVLDKSKDMYEDIYLSPMNIHDFTSDELFNQLLIQNDVKTFILFLEHIFAALGILFNCTFTSWDPFMKFSKLVEIPEPVNGAAGLAAQAENMVILGALSRKKLRFEHFSEGLVNLICGMLTPQQRRRSTVLLQSLLRNSENHMRNLDFEGEKKSDDILYESLRGIQFSLLHPVVVVQELRSIVKQFLLASNNSSQLIRSNGDRRFSQNPTRLTENVPKDDIPPEDYFSYEYFANAVIPNFDKDIDSLIQIKGQKNSNNSYSLLWARIIWGFEVIIWATSYIGVDLNCLDLDTKKMLKLLGVPGGDKLYVNQVGNRNLNTSVIRAIYFLGVDIFGLASVSEKLNGSLFLKEMCQNCDYNLANPTNSTDVIKTSESNEFELDEMVGNQSDGIDIQNFTLSEVSALKFKYTEFAFLQAYPLIFSDPSLLMNQICPQIMPALLSISLYRKCTQRYVSAHHGTGDDESEISEASSRCDTPFSIDVHDLELSVETNTPKTQESTSNPSSLDKKVQELSKNQSRSEEKQKSSPIQPKDLVADITNDIVKQCDVIVSQAKVAAGLQNSEISHKQSEHDAQRALGNHRVSIIPNFAIQGLSLKTKETEGADKSMVEVPAVLPKEICDRIIYHVNDVKAVAMDKSVFGKVRISKKIEEFGDTVEDLRKIINDNPVEALDESCKLLGEKMEFAKKKVTQSIRERLYYKGKVDDMKNRINRIKDHCQVLKDTSVDFATGAIANIPAETRKILLGEFDDLEFEDELDKVEREQKYLAEQSALFDIVNVLDAKVGKFRAEWDKLLSQERIQRGTLLAQSIVQLRKKHQRPRSKREAQYGGVLGKTGPEGIEVRKAKISHRSSLARCKAALSEMPNIQSATDENSDLEDDENSRPGLPNKFSIAVSLAQNFQSDKSCEDFRFTVRDSSLTEKRGKNSMSSESLVQDVLLSNFREPKVIMARSRAINRTETSSFSENFEPGTLPFQVVNEALEIAFRRIARRVETQSSTFSDESMVDPDLSIKNVNDSTFNSDGSNHMHNLNSSLPFQRKYIVKDLWKSSEERKKLLNFEEKKNNIDVVASNFYPKTNETETVNESLEGVFVLEHVVPAFTPSSNLRVDIKAPVPLRPPSGDPIANIKEMFPPPLLVSQGGGDQSDSSAGAGTGNYLGLVVKSRKSRSDIIPTRKNVKLAKENRSSVLVKGPPPNVNPSLTPQVIGLISPLDQI